MKSVTIHTDGSCLGNPGPGGWAAILRYNDTEKEIGGGFAQTTNNRMEILAAVSGLALLREPCQVTVVTDSQYLRHAVEKRWLASWMKNGWQTSAKKPVKNKDLWLRLQEQLERHSVSFTWVKGHAGHAENERCDELARAWASRRNLPDDEGFDG